MYNTRHISAHKQLNIQQCRILYVINGYDYNSDTNGTLNEL